MLINNNFLSNKYRKSRLELSNGMVFEGVGIGGNIKTSGEMVFNTGMIGYSEAMTDPSYLGQILVFSFPIIGNYGVPVNKYTNFSLIKGHESSSIKVQGIIVSDIYDNIVCYHNSNNISINDWMKDQDIPGIACIDTRYLVQIIRENCNIFGRIISDDSTFQNKNKFLFLNNFKSTEYVDPSKYNLMPSVSTKKRIVFGKGKKKIAIIDCGTKWNIIRMFIEKGCQVELLPWDIDFSNVDCDGWVISNGPGDPKNTGNLVNRVKFDILCLNKPVLGICLGHQILSLSTGIVTERLKHGHRSHNQPIFSLPLKKGYITSQNHGYVVKKELIKNSDWNLWFENANDGSVEGLKHKKKPFMSVQFHPEASSGPNDTNWIIDDFIRLIR
jgi:carbamoyl-phosphate synthase small subunit